MRTALKYAVAILIMMPLSFVGFVAGFIWRSVTFGFAEAPDVADRLVDDLNKDTDARKKRREARRR